MTDPLIDTPVLERTTAAVLERQAKLRPEKVALIGEDGTTLTYAELQEQAFRVSTALTGLGVERQDQVLMMLDNHVNNVVAWLGVTCGAGIATPLNTAFKGEMLSYVIAHSGAKVLIIESAWADRLAALGDSAPDLTTVILHGAADGAALPERFQRVEFDELLKADSVRPEPPAVWDVASMIFTSGTEGRSKGVLCPHGHAFSMASYPPLVSPDEVVIVTLPLFHAAGLWAGVYNALRCGGTAVIHGGFSASKFWDQVRLYGATTTVLLGAMADFLWRQPPTPQDAQHTLTMAAVIPAPANAKELTARFGFAVGSAYGLTEAGTTCVTVPGEAEPLSCGTPRSFIDVRLVDENDVEVAVGEVGEIVMRSREPWSMMSGYHRMPAETAQAWRNLWLHTGDAARMTEDGHFFYVDRRKDALRRRGENVSSFEVERYILERDDVAAVAVVGVPSEHTEDELKAVLVLAESATFDPVAMLRDLFERMPYFMVPRYLEVVEELPLTPTHKIMKQVLRKAGVTEGTWDSAAAGFKVTRDRLIEPTPA